VRHCFDRVGSIWQNTETVIIAVALFVILGLGASQIAMRNLADAGWVWADGLIRHLVLVIGFLGASLAAAQGRHITVDALSKVIQGKWLRLSQIVTALAAAVVAGALFWAGVEFVQMERLSGDSLLNGHLPTWIVQLVIPYTFASVAIRILGRMFLSADHSEDKPKSS